MEGIDGADRLSSLPESMLLHIMSFLPFKQVAQTSILSKTWNRAWHRFPVLNFDRTFFKYNLWLEAQSRDKFLTLFNYVEETLKRRHRETLTIKKLALDLVAAVHGVEISSFVDRCLGYAIDCNVKELDLGVSAGKKLYNLPQMILCSESIEVLTLCGYKLESPRSVKLSSLRKLYLGNVCVADQVIEDIVSRCPLVEDISLFSCKGFKTLQLLDDLYKLKKITLHCNRDLEWVKIKAINVEKFEFYRVASVCCEINLVHCKKLNSLNLHNTPITEEWLYNHISKFPFLETLVLNGCGELKRIKILCPSLRRLLIRSCEKLVEVKLETPNLRIFKYGGDLISFSSGDMPQSKAELHFFSENINTQWYFKYVELLAKFHHCFKVLNLESNRGENVFFPEELRELVYPPFCGVNDMDLSIDGPYLCAAVRNAVDGLLWISPHAETLSIKDTKSRKKLLFKFEFSYKEQLNHEIVQCCKTFPVACWQKCIEEVKVEYNFDNQVEHYIFKGEEIWEEMNCLTALQPYALDY